MSLQRVVLGLVQAERENQDAKWGAHRDLPSGIWLAILLEEIGEVAKIMLEDPSQEAVERLSDELIQVAAVAVAWIEGLATPTDLDDLKELEVHT